MNVVVGGQDGAARVARFRSFTFFICSSALAASFPFRPSFGDLLCIFSLSIVRGFFREINSQREIENWLFVVDIFLLLFFVFVYVVRLRIVSRWNWKLRNRNLRNRAPSHNGWHGEKILFVVSSNINRDAHATRFGEKFQMLSLRTLLSNSITTLKMYRFRENQIE